MPVAFILTPMDITVRPLLEKAFLHLYTNHCEKEMSNAILETNKPIGLSMEKVPDSRRAVPASLANSQNLLYAVKTETPTRLILKDFAMLDPLKLVRELAHEEDRKAFWINIFNALFQLAIEQYPSQAINKLKKQRLFVIAGNKLSLNQIENGMLRDSSINLFGQWFRNPVATRFEEMMRVRTDYRLHFSINKGSSQCPAIRFYSGKKLEEELNLATREYLKKYVTVDDDRKVIVLPAKLQYHSKDFGSLGHIKELLKIHQLLSTEQERYSMSFRKENCIAVPGYYFIPQPVFNYSK
jgi:Protein of unknown function, DUF547